MGRPFPSRKWIYSTVSALITRGKFARFKVGDVPMVRSGKYTKAAGKNLNLSRAMKLSHERRETERNGVSPPSAFEQDLSATQLLLVDKMVQDRLARIMEDNSFCSRCGKSLQEQLMAASFKHRNPIHHG